MSRNRARPRNSTGGEPGDRTRRDLPGPALAGQLTRTAGPRERYAGHDDDAVMLAAGRWDALESWVHGRKLAAARELVRRRPAAGAVVRLPGAVPSAWRKDLAAEIACELAVTSHAAETLAGLAVVLETRLPLTAAALDAGILNASKARLIAEETAVLTDEQAGLAEAEIAGRWAGQTWSRIRDLITRAVINADPEAATKRREDAEREDARVRFFRDQAGTCGLAGYSLPPDAALRASQGISGRARAYRAWGIGGTMEQLRVLAFLDLLAGRDARAGQPKTAPARGGKPGTPHGDGHRGRPAGGAGHGTDSAGPDGDAARDQGAGRDSGAAVRDEDDWDSLLGHGPADSEHAGDDTQDHTGQHHTGQDQTGQDQTGRDEDGWDSLLGSEPADDTDGQDGDGQDQTGQDGGGQDGGGQDGGGQDGDGQDGDGRDGDGQDGDGRDGDGEDGGGGHGPGNGGDGRGPSGPAGPGNGAGDAGLAANVDLIIPLADLTRYAQRAGHAPALGALDPGLARRLAGQAAKNPASSFRIILTGPHGHAIGSGQATRTPRKRRPGAAPPPSPSPGPAGDPPDHPAMRPARFTPAGTGPDGGYGTWQLDIGGTTYRVRLHPIQTSGPCDHRYQSAGYQPGPVLRRLVQVRDGECLFPGCPRPASGGDWEHAQPWPAGRTCTCNGGIQCHHHNLLKQDPRWAVRQNPGGSRTWTTPAGLTYTKNTKQYPT